MAWLTQGLPVVRTVPEQHLIALVWSDVVYHCGRDDLPLLITVSAQGMLCEEGYPGLAPLVVIATLVCSTPVFHAAT